MRAKNQGAMKDAPRGMSINRGSTCRSRADSVKSGGAAMQQIADWLEKLGMSEYVQRFAENDIDIEVLSELTDTDFDRLSVSIGHRRKLLKALAAGGPTAAAASPSSAMASPLAPEQGRTAETARPLSPSTAGERRHLTVLFCDLVGSTGISAQ